MKIAGRRREYVNGSARDFIARRWFARWTDPARCVYCGRGCARGRLACGEHSDLPALDPYVSAVDDGDNAP